MKQQFILWIALLLMPLGLSAQADHLLERGEGMFTFQDPINPELKPVDVHYYIPEKGDVTQCPVIFVFQGNDRDYTYLMDAWGKEAKEKHFMLFVPQFPMDDYPLYLYQEVGVMNKKHTELTPRDKTTASMIDRIFEYVKGHTSTLRGDYEIYGHSAGGQFIQRFMLYHESPYVSRAIVGSPGWYSFPDATLPFSYGIKDVPYVDSLTLKKWLNKDIVIQTATLDTVREWFLRKTPEADAQGRNRLERGKRFYAYCRELAAKNNWPFRWREQTVVGVDHNSVKMGQAAFNMLLQPTDPVLSTPTIKNLRSNGKIASYQEVEKELRTLALQHPELATLQSYGKTPQGREVIALHIGGGKKDAVKVWLQGGLHGNEPAPVESVCLLAHYLLETEEGKALAANLDIMCLAVANPDGYDQLKRASGMGLDLNRDMTKMNDPMTLLLKKAWLAFQPQVSFDIHEFNPRRKEVREFYGQSLEHNYDVLLMTSGHPNISQGIKELQQHVFVSSMQQALNQCGYTFAPYFTPYVEGGKMNARLEAKSPQSSATWNALASSISLFAEIKGIGYGEKLFTKRAMIGFTLARDVLLTANEHRYQIRQATQGWKMPISVKDSVTVKFKPLEKEVTYQFVNWKNGQTVSEDMIGHNGLHPVATLKRSMPKGYLLNVAQCQPIINRLKALGVKLETPRFSQAIKVEKYRVKKLIRQAKEWEQIHPVSVETQVSQASFKTQKGWVYVSLNQPLKKLLATLLEPESENGFVAFEVASAQQGMVLPWMRVCQ